MAYYKIGQRIRRFRKANSLSQEELAEKVNISTTHMSHIETGNTKLSLPVLVDIATILKIKTDDLLCDSKEVSGSSLAEISYILESCSEQEAKVIADIVKATKHAMDRHL